MSEIQTRVFARAGFLGNPSDGFGGKTISFSVRQYSARINLEESEKLEIIERANRNTFDSIQQLVQRVRQHGYYDAVRLIKATIKRFFEFFERFAQRLGRNFRIRYESNIPRSVGLAGSSAIVVATLNALEQYFDLTIPLHVKPSLALSVELQELGIPAGLQDRVIQCYEGIVFMDFDPDRATKHADMICGRYFPMDKNAVFDQLFVAFGNEAGQPTEVPHNNLKKKFAAGDKVVVAAMQEFATIAEKGRSAFETQDIAALNKLINANFDLRQSICPLHPLHAEMVQTARESNASAKYCGSGGAIVGICSDKNFSQLRDNLARINCTVIRPEFVQPEN